MGEAEGEGPHIQEAGRRALGRTELDRLLKRHGLSADKRLGQHFLVSPSVVFKIVARADGAVGVLEIGPGPGVLTAPLSLSCSTIAIELDQRMAAVLEETAPEATVIIDDVLRVDLASILKRLKEPRCIVSNMPYNITGPLLERISDHRSMYRNAVLMMQKEVAKKIIAAPGDSARGSLSVCLQLMFDIQKVCSVPASAFLPPPKVDSMVLNLQPRSGLRVTDSERSFIRAGFAQPRKTLANNLRVAIGPEAALEAVSRLGLSKSVRPHELTNEHWVELARTL